MEKNNFYFIALRYVKLTALKMHWKFLNIQMFQILIFIWIITKSWVFQWKNITFYREHFNLAAANHLTLCNMIITSLTIPLRIYQLKVSIFTEEPSIFFLTVTIYLKTIKTPWDWLNRDLKYCNRNAMSKLYRRIC